MTFLDDLDIVDPAAVESSAPQYPVAQWLHGDPKLAAAGGVAHTGGLILPTKHIDESLTPPAGWSRTTIAFSSGKSENVLACAKPYLAVIRQRFRWFVVQGGQVSYAPRSAYREGMRGHVQVLALARGFEFPIVVTFKGKASQEFERLAKAFQAAVDAASAPLLKGKQGRFPRFAFYMPLVPGPHVKVGQKGQESIITPPILALPEKVDADVLKKLYIGREALVAAQAYYHAAAEWTAAWDKGGAEAENGEEQGTDFAPPPAPYPPPPDHEGDDVPLPYGDVDAGPQHYLTAQEALGAVKKAGLTRDDLMQALVEANGRATYSPERDTALVHRLIAQHIAPSAEIEF